jgi:hypothetical protein
MGGHQVRMVICQVEPRRVSFGGCWCRSQGSPRGPTRTDSHVSGVVGYREPAPTGAATVAPNPDHAVIPLRQGQERGTQKCGRSGRPRGEADT